MRLENKKCTSFFFTAQFILMIKTMSFFQANLVLCSLNNYSEITLMPNHSLIIIAGHQSKKNFFIRKTSKQLCTGLLLHAALFEYKYIPIRPYFRKLFPIVNMLSFLFLLAVLNPS